MADPVHASRGQRQLAAEMGISLGKANTCLRALVEKGLVRLGNFSKSPNKRHYAFILTPAGLADKNRIALAFPKRKEVELEAIRLEIDVLGGELDSSGLPAQTDEKKQIRQISIYETGKEKS